MGESSNTLKLLMAFLFQDICCVQEVLLPYFKIKPNQTKPRQSFLLDAYKKFDKDLTEENIQQHVRMQMGTVPSSTTSKVLHFLREKSIHLFIMSPETIGVTQT